MEVFVVVEYFCPGSAYKRASLACAARMADILCPPEAPFGRLWSPLINYMGDNISKYVSPTNIIDIARKSTEFRICTGVFASPPTIQCIRESTSFAFTLQHIHTYTHID